MRSFRLYFIAIFRTLLAPLELLIGRREKVYVNSIVINAPRHLVWGLVTAEDLTLGEWLPVHYQTTYNTETDGTFHSKITVAEQTFNLFGNVLEFIVGKKLVLWISAQDSDPEVVVGNNCIVSTELTDAGETTRMTIAYQVEHTSALKQLLVPFEVAAMNLRIARAAERRAAVNLHSKEKTVRFEPDGNAIRDALVTGALTFASFLMFFHWTSALILLLLILVHEIGHIIAMRQMGHAVQGIYFVPFMGGLAVSRQASIDEGERGYIALMGPGFSVFSTAALAFFAIMHPEIPYLTTAAYMSAFLNGLNLLPILPLDGGNVVGALLSRNPGDLRNKIQQVVLVAVVGYCAFQQFWIGAFIAMSTLMSMQQSDDPHDYLLPITKTQRLWLAIAYFATIAFYASIVLMFS